MLPQGRNLSRRRMFEQLRQQREKLNYLATRRGWLQVRLRALECLHGPIQGLTHVCLDEVQSVSLSYVSPHPSSSRRTSVQRPERSGWSRFYLVMRVRRWFRRETGNAGRITAPISVSEPDNECASEGNQSGNATCCGATKRSGLVETERPAVSPRKESGNVAKLSNEVRR